MPDPIICQSHLARLLSPVAENLGLDIEISKTVSRPLGINYVSISAAISPHKQIVTYRAADHSPYRERLMSRPSTLPSAIQEDLQSLVNSKLSELPFGQTYTFRFTPEGGLIDIEKGITEESLWTVDVAKIGIFENAIRASHDLPLGESLSLIEDWRTLTFEANQDLDMKRPYLHLFAHNPRYRIHKFSSHSGFMSVSGDGDLTESICHAIDYLEGIVNE